MRKTNEKQYFNVSVIYPSGSYAKDKLYIWFREYFISFLIAITLIFLCLFDMYVFNATGDLAERIINAYAVGILDRVFVHTIRIIIVFICIALTCVIFNIATEYESAHTIAAKHFFLAQKYMKFLCRDGKVVCYHEGVNEDGMESTIEDLEKIIDENMVFRCKNEDGKFTDVSKDELHCAVTTLSPLGVTVNLCNKDVVEICFYQTEKKWYN